MMLTTVNMPEVTAWAQDTGKATGYEIRYSLKSNMTGAKTIKVKGAAKVSANVTKLVKNKRYNVSVRCYKTVGKVTYYSTWSAAKNTVVKK